MLNKESLLINEFSLPISYIRYTNIPKTLGELGVVFEYYIGGYWIKIPCISTSEGWSCTYPQPPEGWGSEFVAAYVTLLNNKRKLYRFSIQGFSRTDYNIIVNDGSTTILTKAELPPDIVAESDNAYYISIGMSPIFDLTVRFK